MSLLQLCVCVCVCTDEASGPVKKLIQPNTDSNDLGSHSLVMTRQSSAFLLLVETCCGYSFTSNQAAALSAGSPCPWK